ncbi:MAG: DUF1570 domain-containing protein [Kiritimatiellaceae bacterium]|nr:DUF1570 domain-containing protein [Kiritimatiellaceae bacterium]
MRRCDVVDEKEHCMSTGFKVTLMVILLIFSLVLIVFRPNELANGEKWTLYDVLMSRLGHAPISVVLTNRVIVLLEPENEEESPPTDHELEVKTKLEKILVSREPSCRLIRTGAGPMEGDVIEETADYILFGQRYGDSAELKVKVPRSEIVRMEKLSLSENPEITVRDVRFHEQYPDLFFFKAIPYTVVSQESYFAVKRMIQEQQRLYSEFILCFGSLISIEKPMTDIQVLVFSDRDLYNDYMVEHAPDFINTSGLYVSRQKRLITYHQRDSQWVEANSKKIDEMAAQHREKYQDDRSRERIRQWQVLEKNRLHGAAQQATDRTLRHEGAHQLFFSLGIQDRFQQGRIWATEGLATYCETDKIGWKNDERIYSLQQAVEQNRLSSLSEILSKTKLPDVQSYAEVWSLVYLLMQPQYQAQFFDYLRWLRESSRQPPNDPAGELMDFLKTDMTQFELEWRASVEQSIRSIKGK